jgi:hypothetical protein
MPYGKTFFSPKKKGFFVGERYFGNTSLFKVQVEMIMNKIPPPL